MTVTPELDIRFREAAIREGIVDVRYDLVESPVGELLLAATDRGLARISYTVEGADESLARAFGVRVLRSPLDDVRRELDEYFEGRRHEFDLALDLRVTGFQETVLRELARIPYGRTDTYGHLAAKAGRPRAARAVGMVMNRNPIPIVLPCHRIVGANGSLTGYAGGLDVKRALLELEGVALRDLMDRALLEPLFALRLQTPRLELRLPVGDELVELAHVAEAGVHPPETMPFRVAWTDAAGEVGFDDTFVAHHEEQRDTWRPTLWRLNLGVWAEGEPAGSQSIEAENFAVTRTVSTGSWLGQQFQGRGGTEMRAAVLELAFAGLHATRALSGAIEGNAASERVSMKLGYASAGEGVVSPRGVPLRELEFVLTRDGWAAHRTIPVAIEGLEPCLPLFGL